MSIGSPSVTTDDRKWSFVVPGESQRMTFSEPGYYFGVCTVRPHETTMITVWAAVRETSGTVQSPVEG